MDTCVVEALGQFQTFQLQNQKLQTRKGYKKYVSMQQIFEPNFMIIEWALLRCIASTLCQCHQSKRSNNCQAGYDKMSSSNKREYIFSKIVCYFRACHFNIHICMQCYNSQIWMLCIRETLKLNIPHMYKNVNSAKS